MLFRSKQKTAYEIVYRDWSSDVCSSDLSHGNTGNSPVHTAMLDVQITGADRAQCHPDDGIPGIQNLRLRLVQKGEFSVFDVC